MDEDKKYYINDKYLTLTIHPDLQINRECQCDAPVKIIQGDDVFHGLFELHCEQCDAKAYLLSATKSLELNEPSAVISHRK